MCRRGRSATDAKAMLEHLKQLGTEACDDAKIHTVTAGKVEGVLYSHGIKYAVGKIGFIGSLKSIFAEY